MSKLIYFILGIVLLSVFVLAWTPPGDINLRNFYEIINATNVSANYYFGQPIEGYLGSGIIWAEEFDDNGLLNVSASGLDVTLFRFYYEIS